MKNGASTVCRHCGRCWGWHGPCRLQEKLVEGERRETNRRADLCNPVQTLQRHNQRGRWGHRGGPYPTLGESGCLQSHICAEASETRQGQPSGGDTEQGKCPRKRKDHVQRPRYQRNHDPWMSIHLSMNKWEIISVPRAPQILCSFKCPLHPIYKLALPCLEPALLPTEMQIPLREPMDFSPFQLRASDYPRPFPESRMET